MGNCGASSPRRGRHATTPAAAAAARNPQVAELQREVSASPRRPRAGARRASSRRRGCGTRPTRRGVASDLRDDLRAAEGQRDEAADAARKLERTVARLKGDVDAAAGRRDAADARALHEAAAALDAARQAQRAAERATAPSPTRRGCRRRSTRRGPVAPPRRHGTPEGADVTRLEAELAAARKAEAATAARVGRVPREAARLGPTSGRVAKGRGRDGGARRDECRACACGSRPTSAPTGASSTRRRRRWNTSSRP